MPTITRWSRMAYSLCVIATAIEQMVFETSDFFSDVVPKGAVNCGLVYSWGVLFALSGLALLFNKYAYSVALVSAGVFLLLLLLVQIPHVLFFSPDVPFHWAPVQETSAFVGASLIMAGSYWAPGDLPGPNGPGTSRALKWLEKLVPFGGLFFSVMLIIYGIDHFVYVDMVSTLVPSWIPGAYFWTYFCGVALIGAGVAITLKIQLKAVGILLALMFFGWFLLVHIPRALHIPAELRELEYTRVFVTFGFTGISLLIAYSGRRAAGRK